jgi:Zn-dependent peptidase ImmA (M78 family)
MLTGGEFERLGDSATFAVDLKLLPDPDGDLGAPATSVGSWGQWRLWIGGLNLCEHELIFGDGRVEARKAVTWYLVPFIRWLGEHWGPLLHEERFPRGLRLGELSRARTARDAYLSVLETRGDDLSAFEPWQNWAARHSVRWAAEGGLTPDVFMRRVGDDIEFSWGNRLQPGGESAQFWLEPGVAHAPVSAVGDALGGALDWFVNQPDLAGRGWFGAVRQMIKSGRRSVERSHWLSWYLDGSYAAGPLTELFNRLRAWPGIAGAFQEAAAANYLDPLSPAAAMFGALSPEISETAAARLLAIVSDAYQDRANTADLDQFVTDRPAWSARSPWAEGYQLARDFIEATNLLRDETPIDLDKLLDRLGIKRQSERLEEVGPRGAALAGEGFRPTIVINRDHPMNRAAAGQRFSIAHELCHILHDRGRGRRVTHSSTPWAPAVVEQRANAFAAMLLMSPEVIRRVVPDLSGDVSLNRIAEAAMSLQVSVRALIQHLANLNEIADEDRERLLQELEEASSLPRAGR